MSTLKESSLEALEHINTTKTKQKHFKKIISAFKKQIEAYHNHNITAVCLANSCDLTRLEISRRLNEMVKLKIIEFTGDYRRFPDYPIKFGVYKLK